MKHFPLPFVVISSGGNRRSTEYKQGQGRAQGAAAQPGHFHCMVVGVAYI